MHATVSEIRSASFGSDVIVAQDPPPNTPGAQVSLLVNRAEQVDQLRDARPDRRQR